MKVKPILISVFYLFSLTSTATAMDIFVSIAPQKWLADNLGGEYVSTHVLVGEGQDPHTFEPTPRQMVKLSKARLYFTVDMEFEHLLVNRLGKSLDGLKFINSARHIKKLSISPDDHDLSQESHNSEEGHSHESYDPHIWLSPHNLKIMAEEMAAAMIEYDPVNSKHYRDYLLLFIQKLDTLHERIRLELKPFSGRTFYVFHPSFGYFAHDYGLHQKAVEVSGKSPSPKQLTHLIAQAKKDKVKIIFVQPQFDSKSGEAIARAIDGAVVPLDPLAGDVAKNLEMMAQKIKNALSRQGTAQ